MFKGAHKGRPYRVRNGIPGCGVVTGTNGGCPYDTGGGFLTGAHEGRPYGEFRGCADRVFGVFGPTNRVFGDVLIVPKIFALSMRNLWHTRCLVNRKSF